MKKIIGKKILFWIIILVLAYQPIYLQSNVRAADYNVIADYPVNELAHGINVTFDWHLRTDVTQTKFVLRTNAGDITEFSSVTNYTWHNFPYGSGWWKVDVWKQGGPIWYGETTRKHFHHEFPVDSTIELQYTVGSYDGNDVVFYEVSKDYDIFLPDYFLNPDDLPTGCEQNAGFYEQWSLSLPESSWDFIEIEYGVLTIKQGYRWDGTSKPGLQDVEYKSFHYRSSLVHDALYDLMRMDYLRADTLVGEDWVDGYHNRELADIMHYLIAREDGQGPAGAQDDFNWLRLLGGDSTHNNNKLKEWKYHVFELSANPSDSRVDLEWKKADFSEKDPHDEPFGYPHGYHIMRNGEYLESVSPETIAYTDNCVDDGTTYSYQICPNPSNTNLFDYSNKVFATPINEAPIVDAGPDISINEGEFISSSGSFNDSVADTWTATVDYGTGEGANSLPLTYKTFSLNWEYPENGVYTITVTITDNDGGVGTDTATVDVNGPPVADTTGSDQLVHDYDCSGDEPVNLVGTSSTDSDGTITSYVWKEGATTLGTGATLSTTLPLGIHTITLTVMDDDSVTDTDTVTVDVNDPPVADSNGPYRAEETNVIQFDGSDSFDSDGTIISYEWDFGDGETNSGANPRHGYQEPGNYTVILTVTDEDGATNSTTTWAMSYNDPPIIELIYPTDDIIVNGNVNIEWFAVEGAYPEEGEYIYIYYKPENTATYRKITDDLPLANTGEYGWDTSNLDDGQYTLLIEAIDQHGNIAHDSCTFHINNHEDPIENEPPIKPAKPIGDVSGKPDEKYTYTTTTNDPDGDQIWFYWDFGDGTSSGWLGPYNNGGICGIVYSWNEDGEYSVKVKAKDVYGDESPWSDPLEVSMPKTKTFNQLPKIILWLFERFPFLQSYFSYFI
ncbi:PKD domain-containing protein [Thermoplasmatota archaeon]